MEIKLESLGKVQINITQRLFIIVYNCYIFLTFIDIENTIYNFKHRILFISIYKNQKVVTYLNNLFIYKFIISLKLIIL